MDDLRVLFWLLKGIAKLLFVLFRTVFRMLRWLVRRVRPAPVEALAAPPTMTRVPSAPPPVKRSAVEALTAKVQALATLARATDGRCATSSLCAPLQPTLRDFLLPRLQEMQAELRRVHTAAQVDRIAASLRYLNALTQLLARMAEQRADPNLDELIDDADTLAEACYRPVVDYCRTNDVPLSSNRTAAVFGDDCSPSLGRIDDPTGLAILHLPWKWLAEVHRWPAIGHEVGHDFYASVAGLDEQLLRQQGLSDVVDQGQVVDRGQAVTSRDVDRLVTHWRHELVADAFGVMMLGPAYAVTTATILAQPDEPGEVLAAQTDGDEYEVHPPGHLRVAAVCRLLARLGHGALGDELERRWRDQHGDPAAIFLQCDSGWLRVGDQPFIKRAVALTSALYSEGFAALREIPLASMPGFDFGPREHEAALRVKDAFLTDKQPRPTDARLLIAGAVLAWAQRPADNVRLLRAARIAVGRLPLPVPGAAVTATSAGRPASIRALVRDAIILDVLLSPPQAALALAKAGRRR
ncbi:MAG TPA: hypothetical protein VNO55_24360 [Polyangia bacterium]|nr:hypothetical protein [Polyangia bacterium]